jgi:hypothetical protein
MFIFTLKTLSSGPGQRYLAMPVNYATGIME